MHDEFVIVISLCAIVKWLLSDVIAALCVCYCRMVIYVLLRSVIALLDRCTVQLLADNPRVQQFAPALSDALREACAQRAHDSVSTGLCDHCRPTL